MSVLCFVLSSVRFLSCLCVVIVSVAVSVCGCVYPITRKVEHFYLKQSREFHSNTLILNKDEKSNTVQFNLKQSRDSTVPH